jgi:hypothetical protein
MGIFRKKTGAGTDGSFATPSGNDCRAKVPPPPPASSGRLAYRAPRDVKVSDLSEPCLPDWSGELRSPYAFNAHADILREPVKGKDRRSLAWYDERIRLAGPEGLNDGLEQSRRISARNREVWRLDAENPGMLERQRAEAKAKEPPMNWGTSGRP